jgi:hypothetical protein
MPQRSPIIFWLLFAATLCVDAVAIDWSRRASFETEGELFAGAFWYALATGQLSLVAIWSVMAAKRRIVAVVASIAAVAIVAYFAPYYEVANFADNVTWYGTHVLGLTLVLWLLRRTALWRRFRAEPTKRWQFSLAHLVMLMTVIAVLLVFARFTIVFQMLTPAVLVPPFIIDILLAITTVMLAVSAKPAILRIALIAAVAISLGMLQIALLHWVEPMAMSHTVIPALLIQAAVLVIWLELGQIIPRANNAEDRDASTSSSMPEPPLEA